ncbi:MAG: Arc family DNA-binding protein [Syntrophobacteraceae bacterium]
MPTMTIKNIPEDIYLRIKQSALEHGRSINNEVIYCLKRALQGGRIDPETTLERIRILRKQIPLPFLTDDLLRFAKEEGRP